MSRRKDRIKRKKQQARTKAPSTQTSTSPETVEQVLANVESAAMAEAVEADFEAIATASAPEPESSAGDLVKRATDALAVLESQRVRAAHAESEAVETKSRLEDQLCRIEEERGSLRDGKEDLAREARDLATRGGQLGQREEDVSTRHEEIIQRELDADAGFIRRNRDALRKLEGEGEALREQYSRHSKDIDCERTALEQEVRATRAELRAEADAARDAVKVDLAAEKGVLTKARQVLEDEHKRLRKEAKDLELDRELFDEDRGAQDEKVARLAAREIETREGQISALTERMTAAREDRDRLATLLAEREEADRRFGNETPDQVMTRVRSLQEERDKLREALGARPSAAAAQRLELLEQEKELWESDRLKLLSEREQARQEAARRRIAVTELEALRDEKRSLESANALLHEANRQLRTEVDALVKGVEGKSPFPSCSAMDGDNELQSSRPTTDTIKDFAEFAHYVRHRMAWDPKTKKELYYSAVDVRSFLGGLAMSRLHLLQGISGTGKTSLPLAFARAVGAGAALVEVQAGWRDRQDLIGHFNTFERRFYESEFLQAMYRASTPAFADRPFVIVLDEMNLSHPEQYFADMLSALAQDPDRQRLTLMTAAVDPAPQLLIEGGTKLPIPANVWFVGTANHDETTKDFADKTYDRAHVMELPRTRKKFEYETSQPQHPISVAALNSAFDEAVQEHEAEATKAYDFLQAHLGEALGRRFRVGWGNRLERQMGLYVPVVIAAGGSVGEATDHVLATKLLRKIRDRHDNRPDDVVALRDQIRTEWSILDSKAQPVRSMEMLSQELRRLNHDDE